MIYFMKDYCGNSAANESFAPNVGNCFLIDDFASLHSVFEILKRNRNHAHRMLCVVIH